MKAATTTRLATLDDAEAIRSIYNREVETSTVTFDLVPRTLDAQRQWLTERSGAHAVLVAETEGPEGRVVVGFGSLSPWRDRPAYRTSVEDSVYVRSDRRGSGVGRVLLSALLDVAGEHGFHTVLGRIVGGHEASIALHESCGFRVVGVEKEVGRKFNRWLDVVVMQRMLSPAP